MTRLTIPDMDCDGCVGAITRAVQKQDPAATVHADLASHVVEISSRLAPAALARVIDAAGFTIAAGA